MTQVDSKKPKPPHSGGTAQLAEFIVHTSILMHAYSAYRKTIDGFPDLVRFLPQLASELGPKYPDQPGVQKLVEAANEVEAMLALPDTQVTLERVHKFALESVLTRMVDRFEYYLARIVRRAIEEHPSVLDDATFTAKELAEYANLQEAITYKMDAKVHQVTMSGLDGVALYLKKQFGVSVEWEASAYAIVREAIEVRHLLVHNAGKVDGLFQKRTGRKDIPVGDQYPITREFVVSAFKPFIDVADRLDKAFAAKFQLKLKAPEQPTTPSA